MQPAIEISHLVKKFGRQYALKDISLSIPARQFIAVVGPNGAGKTTLIRILATLIRPSSGQIQIAGFDLLKHGHQIRSRLGVIGHLTFLYQDLSARENLLFYGRMYHTPMLNRQVDDLLDKVGLSQRANHPVGGFSRGMLQRLSIARALLHQPEILLFDEPYTGLDPKASEMLSALLKSLLGTQHTILMVTHNLAQAAELADQVAILANGQIVLNQPSADLSLAVLTQRYNELTGEPTRANA